MVSEEGNFVVWSSRWALDEDGKIKWRAVGRVYVIGLIGDFAPALKHPVLSLAKEASMISTLRATAAMPTAADSPPLLVLLQCDNYMR